MSSRQLALIAGSSYLVIFVAAIFANFFVLDLLLQSPLEAIAEQSFIVRVGIMAFLITAVFDVIVAWALYDLYKSHPLSLPSTYFRLAHAIIMGVAVFALLNVFVEDSAQAILAQVTVFNNIWLIGLLFFGVHLLCLSRIVKHITFIPYLLFAAGVMYIVDTGAHFLLENYHLYAGIFLTLVAIPSIFGEMAFSIWLLVKGGKN
ncbi:DUF4386 domain-containing protein [Candidatus Nomurabacteria bacterium]|nr:DUF4386 domain-containing protein [Candidatus Nomurabacteria bacterium]MCB9819355.1 DUF4386 domain-containing protein [Candidatus Nomurabacteria bacterium]